MPHKADLGPSLGTAPAALVLFLVVPLLALLLRWRWRTEAERQEEVRQLMILAAEEAERAEMEAATGQRGPYQLYSEYLPAWAPAAPPPPPPPERASEPTPAVVTTPSLPVPRGLVCALCFGPATARCSRCKAVRYCSGKCQINHWRQGHKDNCHPPGTNDDDCIGRSAASPSSRVESEQLCSTGDTLELEEYHSAKACETSPENHEEYHSAKACKISPESDVIQSVSSHIISSEDGMLPAKTSVEASGQGSDFTTPVPKYPSSSGSKSISDGDTATAETTVYHNARRKEPSAVAVSSSSLRSTVDHTNDKTTKTTPSEPRSANSMEKNISHSIQKNVFASKPKAVEYSISDRTDRITPVSSDSTVNKHSELTGKVESTKLAKNRATEIDARNSTSAGFISLKGIQHSNDIETQAVQIPNLDSSAMGIVANSEQPRIKEVLSRVNGISSKAGSASTQPTRLSNGTDSIPTAGKRVVEQSITPKLSKRYPPEMMLFPYDLFIKLYNSDKVELRPCGLTNCGNSCYANSVLQCLAFTRPLTAYLLEGLHSKICPKKEWCFICEFEGLLRNMKRGKSPLSPIGILSNLENIGSSLGRGRQEDAHEFLRYATDAMQLVCLKEAGARSGGLLAEETTLVQQTFGGYLLSKIKCGRCKGRTERCERMMDLTVEIPGDIDSLEEALSRFTSTEILDGENKYECNRCGSYERAKKKLTILEAPNVLTITLKRFQVGAFGKLNKPVRFPEYLDLAPYLSGTDDKYPIYRLYAMIVHMDILNASFSGHYICYVKDTQGNWYKADDSKVSRVDLREVLSKGAYMLLYARCSPRAPSSVRRAMARELIQIKRFGSKEVMGKSNPNLRQVVQGRSQFYPREPMDDSDRFNERHHHTANDYSSDSSSLFSCSDEGSWSTDSTRDSMTTEELWEFFSGESDQMSLNSLRFSEDSDGFTDSPSSSRHSWEAVLIGRRPDFSESADLTNLISSGRELNNAEIETTGGYRNHGDGRGAWLEGNGSPSSLYTESEHLRNVVDNFRSTETDWISNNKLKSSVSLRRPTRDRTTQTFY